MALRPPDELHAALDGASAQTGSATTGDDFRAEAVGIAGAVPGFFNWIVGRR